ncbi:MAG: carbonic anhydrase [Aquiluna sp.]|jgi:carbonic anhydrase|nr:carbonic anhydrase [Aquiluna sp.]MCF8545364.1 carbonic anhydrase [Aquiluna sp.]
MARPQDASSAWEALIRGNQNFVAGTPAHPRQDADIRKVTAEQQRPFAALFGCADSRLAAEMIFDVGLGDLFVVRNAGQVIAETILGSLEFAVEVLNVPLILVLGHDECGAVRSTMNAADGTLEIEGEYIHKLVSRIMPTVQRGLDAGERSIDDLTTRHIQDTIEEMLEKSDLISSRVKTGKLAVVGANYKLELGEVHMVCSHGEIA